MAKKPEPTPDLPVYLFTGFLDAGKTRFIQETLEDSRFHQGERTLLTLKPFPGRSHARFTAVTGDGLRESLLVPLLTFPALQFDH